MDNPKPVFFENLDGLRAIAFASVFLFHCFGYIAYSPGSAVEQAISERLVMQGHLGVNLFFVLSGFLISYLLMIEKERHGRIHIPWFYMRRVLRIWPLYFAVLAIGFFVYPFFTGQFSMTDVKKHLLPYLLFLNNFDRIATDFTGAGNDALGVLWSIAVEEQFYLLWPLLLSVFNRKYYSWLFAAVVTVSLIFRALYADDGSRLYLHTLSVMSDLAVGAWLAYQAVYRTALFHLLQNCSRFFIGSVYLLLLALIYWFEEWSAFNAVTIVGERLIFGLLFAFVIAEQCFAKHSLFKLGKWTQLSRIGLISYGLYCLHLFSIVIVQKLNVVFGLTSLTPLIFYGEIVLCLLLSIFISIVSYRYFEKQVLKWKRAFVVVNTRP